MAIIKCPVKIKVSELQHRDIIRFDHQVDEGYSSNTVYRIDNGKIHLYRPYVHTGDVVYSGGQVIPYIGVEDWWIEQDRNIEVWLLRRDPSPLR